jgi:protein-arginine kinase
MDMIIEDYHGHKKADKHVSNMDYKQLKCPPFEADDAKFIKSTRIRVGRNLADYPLGPGASKEQRDEICSKVVTALNSF